jgi:5'-3' exonuclease
VLDAAGVTGKFGVPPASIPDWLALVGDAADGFPGIPGWGAKSAAAVLARYGHLEAIPDDPAELGLPTARAARLVESLRAGGDDARLFLRLATLRLDVQLEEGVADLEWRGVRPGFAALCAALGDESLARRIEEAGRLH